ncbi:LysR family transcriptional regulator [Aeromonas sp. FDAARGOS 1417]|uniref:LysR family transcriptional regulator n=1 Tax=Aeromonas TaxID=642 RepID=UPI001C239F59|nr:LysR family transcriptional regulator [Aeromonas sp. FDAARGOS 1417]QWZ65931.1 LysR family transcriptional regulator [Aeromonas sp. FDAARGOS 1417]
MKTIRALSLFQLTADTGSLSEAARRLNITPAAASMALKKLENELGTSLFLRSTRSMRLTEEGLIYLEHSRRAMQLLTDAREAIQSGATTLRGKLLLSMPSDLGRNVVLPWLDTFQQRHTELKLHLLLTDHRTDIYRQAVDVALRYGLLPDSSLVALPVALHNHRVLCASPAYIERNGAPNSPEELSQHNCLIFILGGYLYDNWRFFGVNEELSIQVSGDRTSDDSDIVRRWAISGHGIIYKSSLDVALDILAGRLVLLCPEWQGEHVPLNLVCANRQRITPALQALRSYLAEQCSLLLSAIERLR